MELIDIKINGTSMNVSFDTTILRLLEVFGFKPDVVIAEVNGVIIKRERYDDTFLSKGDVVELVQFVGGGSR